MTNMISEYNIQKEFHNWCKKQPYIVECWHVPNGMHASSKACAQMKRIGLHKGVCDYWVLLDNCILAAIEFKTASGALSKEQKDFIRHLIWCHYPVKVCRSVYEATQFIKQLKSMNE